MIEIGITRYTVKALIREITKMERALAQREDTGIRSWLDRCEAALEKHNNPERGTETLNEALLWQRRVNRYIEQGMRSDEAARKAWAAA